MTQNELNRAVSRATGESVAEISRRGFTLTGPLPHGGEPQAAERHADGRPPLVVDWDELEASRDVLVPPPPRRRQELARC